nr:hypothetical protein BaRGS_025953 [Batillaria attramentaria]
MMPESRPKTQRDSARMKKICLTLTFRVILEKTDRASFVRKQVWNITTIYHHYYYYYYYYYDDDDDDYYCYYYYCYYDYYYM